MRAQTGHADACADGEGEGESEEQAGGRADQGRIDAAKWCNSDILTNFTLHCSA
jgi:hypothetical protein